MIWSIHKVPLSLIMACAGIVAAPDRLTFTKDIAPLVFENCARCHRPGEAAPFDLLTYEDVRKRARQIVRVTQDRFMPPWLPEPGYGRFAGERRLSDRQIAMLTQWVEEGAVEGDPADLPPLLQFPEGWQLGEPDLVVTMPQAYTLRASPPDVFRYFAAPIPIKGTRYVRSFEFRVDNPRVVHHAAVRVDPTSTSRRLDEEETEPGFSEKDLARNLTDPSGQSLTWTPGKQPFRGREDVAGVLKPNTDAVFELHLLPSGKPERVQAKVGLFFSEKKPTHVPSLLRIGSEIIDIAAAEKNYRHHDRYVLPVDLIVLTVYPHAHYLCKTMKGYATLPDGTTQWLIHIKQWDFNWQDEYRYAEPVFLPKGTTIEMEYVYDNSADNLRNPNNPPKRVVYGPNSWEEMGDLWFQVLTLSEEDRDLLEQDHRRKKFFDDIAKYEQMLRHNPDSFTAHMSLGGAMEELKQFDKAAAHVRHAIRIKPDSAMAHYNLGVVLGLMNKPQEAADQYRKAIRIRPTLADAHQNLGVLLLQSQQLEEAIQHFQQALKVDAGWITHSYLFSAYGALGQLDKAEKHYHAVVQLNRDRWETHYDFGLFLGRQRRYREAAEAFRKALEINPISDQSHSGLADVLAASGQLEDAARHCYLALEKNPHFRLVHFSLGQILRSQGKNEEAIKHLLQTLAVKDARTAHILYFLADSYARKGDREKAIEYAKQAKQRAASRRQTLLGGEIDRLLKQLGWKDDPQ